MGELGGCGVVFGFVTVLLMYWYVDELIVGLSKNNAIWEKVYWLWFIMIDTFIMYDIWLVCR